VVVIETDARFEHETAGLQHDADAGRGTGPDRLGVAPRGQVGKADLPRDIDGAVGRGHRAVGEEQPPVAPGIGAETIGRDLARLRQAVERKIGIGIVEAEAGAISAS
jgi:hypothetical protein